MTALPEPTFHQAVRAIAELARWSDAEVKDQPRDAAWVAYAWIARCRARIEAGDR